MRLKTAHKQLGFVKTFQDTAVCLVERSLQIQVTFNENYSQFHWVHWANNYRTALRLRSLTSVITICLTTKSLLFQTVLSSHTFYQNTEVLLLLLLFLHSCKRCPWRQCKRPFVGSWRYFACHPKGFFRLDWLAERYGFESSTWYIYSSILEKPPGEENGVWRSLSGVRWYVFKIKQRFTLLGVWGRWCTRCCKPRKSLWSSVFSSSVTEF